jgi:thioredoxin-like negative regulator of GroEL
MIAPLVDQLADEYAGKLLAVKLNTDESPNVATEYGIRSIPTVMIFKAGAYTRPLCNSTSALFVGYTLPLCGLT